MKKIIALLLALVMVMGLVACGGSTEPTESAQSGESAKPADSGENQEAQTVVYWAQWSETETQAEVIKEAIARFETNHPEYKVEINWAGREVRDILRTSVDAGKVIDVCETGFDSLLNALSEDSLVDITDLVEQTTLTETVSPGMAAFAKGFSSTGDKWFYIPSQPFVGTVFYNKAIFREAGVDKLPTTWSEFMTACQKIKDAGYYSLTTDDAYASLIYSNWLGSYYGAEVYGEMINDPSHPNWKSDVIKQMGDDFAKMASEGYITPGTGSFVFPSAQNTEFAMGTTAMYCNGSWLPNEVSEITGDSFEWGMMFFPMPEGGSGIQKTYMTGCQFYAVPKTAQNVEGAVLLIEELTSKETQQALLEKCQCIPMVDLELPASLADASFIMSEGENAVPWCYSVATDQDLSAILATATLKVLAGELDGAGFAAEIAANLK